MFPIIKEEESLSKSLTKLPEVLSSMISLSISNMRPRGQSIPSKLREGVNGQKAPLAERISQIYGDLIKWKEVKKIG